MASGRFADYLGKGVIADRPAAPVLLSTMMGIWYSTDTLEWSAWDGTVWLEDIMSGGGGAAWGAITGTLSAQTDLATALSAKADTSALSAMAFSGALLDATDFPGGTTDFLRADGSFAAPPGGGGSLTNWTEATTTLSGVTNSFTALNAATNVSVALVPKGSGAIQAQVQTNTDVGGDARGGYATDWQRTRINADEIAGGVASVLAGGERNKASGNYSSVVGGFRNTASGNSAVVGGSTNTASGDYSVAFGTLSVASGAYSFAHGEGANASATRSFAYGALANANGDTSFAFGLRVSAKGIYGMRAWASGRVDTDGDAQAMRCVQRAGTTNATPTVATTDGSSASSTNQVILENSSAASVRARVLARRDNGNVKTWDVSYTVTRDSGAGTTAIAGTPTVTVVDDPSTTGWTLAVTADTTNGGASITITGAASQNIKLVVDNYAIAYTKG